MEEIFLGRVKSNKAKKDIVDFYYVLAVFLSIWVGGKSQKVWLAILTFIISVCLLCFILSKLKANKRKKLYESGIDEIDNMPGGIFEEYLLTHFNQMGYLGSLTPKTGDYGADLILEKDGRRVVVQAKRWKGSIGVDAIQQVIGAIKYYDANKGMVVTNSTFTENAYELANSNGIELWDRKELIDTMCKTEGKKVIDNIIQSKKDINSDGEICPKCGQKLIVRKGKYGKFIGCLGYPDCKYTKDL